MKRSGPPERRTPLERGTKGLKRSGIERSSGLERGSGLSRGSGLERSGRLAPRSKARQSQMRDDRIPLIESLVAAGVGCEVSMVFEELGIEHRCTRRIEGMHERRKSGSGGSRLNRANLVPACNWCNGALEDATGEDRLKIEASYLVVREGNPEWDALGSRQDRMGNAP